jgi:hypothetical protein
MSFQKENAIPKSGFSESHQFPPSDSENRPEFKRKANLIAFLGALSLTHQYPSHEIDLMRNTALLYEFIRNKERKKKKKTNKTTN